MKLMWKDVLPVFVLVDTIEELKEAVTDPEGFLERLATAAGPAAKRLLLARVRPSMEPMLTKMGLLWSDVVPVFKMIDSIDDLKEAIEDPEGFLAKMPGPIEEKILKLKLKNAMCGEGVPGDPKVPLFEKLWKLKPPLNWDDDMVPVLELVDDIEELRAAQDATGAWLGNLDFGCHPATRRYQISKLKRLLDPLAWKDKVKSDDMLAALISGYMDVGKMADLRAALKDPEAFYGQLKAGAGPASRRLAIALRRHEIEPLLNELGLAWDDALLPLEAIPTMQLLRSRLEDAKALVAQLAEGPLARQLLLLKLKPVLSPHVYKRKLEWGDMERVIERISSMEKLCAAIEFPEAFLDQLASASGPATQRLQVSQIEATQDTSPIHPDLRMRAYYVASLRTALGAFLMLGCAILTGRWRC